MLGEVCTCGGSFGPEQYEEVPYDWGSARVLLAGVKVQRCAACDNYAVDIPKVNSLQRAIDAVAPSRTNMVLRVEYKAGRWTARVVG